MSEPSPSEPPKPLLLSEQLEALRRQFADKPATLGELIVALGSRAYMLLLIIFSLPFIAPVAIPGASTILGIIIASLSAQMAFGRLPWIPQRLLRHQLSPAFFSKLIPVTAKTVRLLERVLHPRWMPLTESALARGLHLGAICIAAILLAAPIFVPFTNLLPGWAILLLACGLLERDGIAIAIGHVSFLATLALFVALGAAATEGVIRLWQNLTG